MRDPKKIYLSAVRDGDIFKLVDQDGRQVWGLQAIDISAAVDEVTTFTARVIDANSIRGIPHINNKYAG